MRTSKLLRVLVTVLILASVLAVSINISFAEGDSGMVRVLPAPTAGSNNIPPAADISADPDISFGSSQPGQARLAMTATADDAEIRGNCSITRLSSSSAGIWGDTTCYPDDPAVRVTLRIQAYYNGAWTTLASVSNSTNGDYVSISRVYNVTPGYYYRCYGVHTSIYDGTVTTCTSGLYIG